MKVEFVIVLISVSIGVSQQHYCCGNNQVFNDETCFDPSTNVQTEFEFKCAKNQKAHILYAKNTNFTVNDGGELQLFIPNNDVRYQPGQFCVGQRVKNFTRTPLRSHRAAYVCVTQTIEYISDEVKAYCMVISSILLFAVACVYATKRKLRTVLGLSTMMFALSLSIGFAILSGMKLVSYSDMNLCAARGFSAYFFLMASFFWMNALAIQMFFKIRDYTEESSSKSESLKPFKWYCLYACWFPLVMTCITASVNFMPGDHIKPGIGLNHCWFFGDKQKWWYLYSFLAALTLANIILFVISASYLWIKRTDIKISKRILVTLRMFILTGVTWIFEMAPGAWFYNVMDVVNCLQGVLIFLVLVLPLVKVCKRSSEDTEYESGIKTKQKYTHF